MKKIFTMLLLSLSIGVSHAEEFNWNQNSNGEGKEMHMFKLNQAQKVAQYNGALTGYASICGAVDGDIKKIENVVFTNFKVIGLNEVDISNLDLTYKQFQTNTINKKSTVSPIECKLFMEEFNKIINAINNPK